MKINLDDPKLTAYALDELADAERDAIEQAISASAEAQAFVTETRQMARLLEDEFAGELATAAEKSINILPLPEQRSFWSDARWMSIGVAALLAVCAVIAAVAISGHRGGEVAYAPRHDRTEPAALGRSDADVQMEVEAEPPAATPLPLYAQNEPERARDSVAFEPAPPVTQSTAVAPSAPLASYRSKRGAREEPDERAPTSQNFNTAEYDQFEENPFLPATTNPLSTFAVDVDTASYANVRRMINAGTKPPKDAVRIEELVNYFTYDYPQPDGNDPFSISLEAASCPWQPQHQLVRIGLKGRDVAANKRAASNLVFLLDVSGSMEPADRLPLIKQLMRLLVDKLGENDHVAIVVYSGASGVALPSTSGAKKEQILRALEELKAGGSTNGAQGIELAYRIAQENFIKGGVNRVLLATDGDFNVGVTSQGDLVRLAEEKAKSGVFLTVLGVGDDNLKDSTMQKLADKANGNYAYLDSVEEARKVLVQQMNGTLVTIAKDVKVQVEFNPARVASYRLIGYEKRMLRKEDFNNDKIDAGEIGAGHSVTALYEIVPAGSQADPAASVPPVDPLKYQPANASTAVNSNRNPNAATEMLTVKLRYKKPDGDSSALIERSTVSSNTPFEKASKDFQFAAAVAEFGMILRESPHKGSGTLSGVVEWAQQAKGADSAGYRAGFIDLVRKAQTLAN